MLVLATLCVLVGSSLSMATGGGRPMMPGDNMMTMMGNDTMPKICCMPPQWEASMVDLNSKDMMVLRFAHDSAAMREGYYVSKLGPNNDKPYLMVFKDFADKKTYTVDLSAADPKDYKCTQTANNEQFYGACVHQTNGVHDLKYIGDATVGPAGSGLHYDGWAMKIANDIEITLSLSRDGCVPLLESVKSQPGSFPAMNNLFMFTDFEPMVEHKELLTIPAPCVNAGSAVVG